MTVVELGREINSIKAYRQAQIISFEGTRIIRKKPRKESDLIDIKSTLTLLMPRLPTHTILRQTP